MITSGQNTSAVNGHFRWIANGYLLGLPVVFQQMPRAVIGEPPSQTLLPPEVPAEEEESVTGTVLTAGMTALTVSVCCTLAAVFQFASPACEAVMTAVPAPTMVTQLPSTVATALFELE